VAETTFRLLPLQLEKFASEVTVIFSENLVFRVDEGSYNVQVTNRDIFTRLSRGKRKNGKAIITVAVGREIIAEQSILQQSLRVSQLLCR